MPHGTISPYELKKFVVKLQVLIAKPDEFKHNAH